MGRGVGPARPVPGLTLRLGAQPFLASLKANLRVPAEQAQQAATLASHGLSAADGAVQDSLVEDVPELGCTRSVQNCLASQTGGCLLV
jgi:hypothetical protein